MMDIKKELERAELQGDVPVEKLSGAVRSIDFTGLELNDEFEIPADFKIMEHTFQGGSKAQYIKVVTSTGMVKDFYPSTFTKGRLIYNDRNEPTADRDVTNGTAAEHWRTFVDPNEALQSIVGKKMKVTETRSRKVRAFNGGTTMTMFYKIDFV
ncbi:MAG: hypothetical protein ACI3VR_04440 [Intestinibacter sp.]|uniref:hypothetical protein n=1 Tax=Intestinibacter sp. TaxID=1965304 RepID=UPI003F1786DC